MDIRRGYRTEDADARLATRILIADDTLSSRELLRFILEDSGHEVAEAEDGEQVMANAVTFEPDIAILDLQMPKLDGWSTFAALGRNPAFKIIPIVALTAA